MEPYKKIFEDFSSDQLVFNKGSEELEKILKTAGVQFRKEPHQGKFYYSFDNKDFAKVNDILKKNGIKPDAVQKALFSSSMEDEHFTKRGYYSETAEKEEKKILDKISKMKRWEKADFNIEKLQGQDLQNLVRKLSGLGHTKTSGKTLAFQKK